MSLLINKIAVVTGEATVSAWRLPGGSLKWAPMPAQSGVFRVAIRGNLM